MSEPTIFTGTIRKHPYSWYADKIAYRCSDLAMLGALRVATLEPDGYFYVQSADLVRPEPEAMCAAVRVYDTIAWGEPLELPEVSLRLAK